MAAGLGFKDFTTGVVLTAADVDGYLMQGVWVFASAAARDAAVTSPQEGNFAYLKDTNVTTYYTGSAWANLDTTGMTNPMTTTGDTIYSSSGSTPARLGIGTAGQVLRVNSGATAPEWATASSGAVVQVKSTTKTDTFSSSGTSFQDVTGLSVSITPTSASNKIFVIASVQGAANRGVTEGNMQLMRDSTAIAIGDADGSRTRTGIEFSSDLYDMSTISLSVLDTPATTAATTYKVQIQTRSSTAYVNRSVDDANSSSAGRGASTITVMEVTP